MGAVEQARADVLIVEDDRAIRESLADLLVTEGYRVAVASNGREALSQLEQAARPRLILLDLMMPVMNGWEFRSQQQDSPGLASIPVVIVSGDGNVAQKAATLHAEAYLGKPVDIDRLFDLVERYCPR